MNRFCFVFFSLKKKVKSYASRYENTKSNAKEVRGKKDEKTGNQAKNWNSRGDSVAETFREVLEY